MRILYLEPWDRGSHAAFTRALTGGLEADWTVLTLPGRHWKWRMRGFSAWAALEHGDALARGHDLVVASAYVPLAELVGLCPALAGVPRVLFFHENQLVYPVREEHAGERDAHFGFTQLVSALAADRCVFNSRWNRDSFLEAAAGLLRRLPDAVPRGWTERIAARSTVLPLPLDLPDVHPSELADVPPGPGRAAGPILLWNHRREYDKAPETFLAALRLLADRAVPFRVDLCGERFAEEPAAFAEARSWLGPRLVHDGWAPTRAAYLDHLRRAQVVVSTAIHEFFGVAVLEAVHLGARPLVPDRLSYPELLPPEARWGPGGPEVLAEALEPLCRGWVEGGLDLRADRTDLTRHLAAPAVLPAYRELFEGCVEATSSARSSPGGAPRSA